MTSSLKRVAAVAAVGAVGVLAPVASAGAATPVLPAGLALPAAHLPLTGLPAFNPAALPAFNPAALPAFDPASLPAFNPAGLAFTGPSVGGIAAVIGPTVITTAPSNFNNTNLQTSAGGNFSGGQAG